MDKAEQVSKDCNKWGRLYSRAVGADDAGGGHAEKVVLRACLMSLFAEQQGTCAHSDLRGACGERRGGLTTGLQQATRRVCETLTRVYRMRTHPNLLCPVRPTLYGTGA